MLELEATPQIFHALRKRGRMASRLWNVFTMFYWSFSSEERLSLGSVSSALVGFSIASSRLLELRFVLPSPGVTDVERLVSTLRCGLSNKAHATH